YIGPGAITRRALWLVADPVMITEGQATPTVWKGSVTGFIAGDGLGANDFCFFAPDNPAAAAAGKYSVMGTLNGATSGDYGLNYTFANAAGNATAFTIKAYVPPTEPQDLFGGNEAAAREYKDTVVVLESTKAGTLPATAVLPTKSVLPTYTDINMPQSMSVEALAASMAGEKEVLAAEAIADRETAEQEDDLEA
ncbi:MAG: hypothetical protein J5963_01710, partial [Schwartzia sp.]|nr:hypothetical protein [Schwartzia sp. (in: firmicutes)]